MIASAQRTAETKSSLTELSWLYHKCNLRNHPFRHQFFLVTLANTVVIMSAKVEVRRKSMKNNKCVYEGWMVGSNKHRTFTQERTVIDTYGYTAIFRLAFLFVFSCLCMSQK